MRTSSCRTGASRPLAAASRHPPGATVVEAKGRPVTPGLFGGVTQFGLEEVSLEASTFDAELKLTAPAWQHMWRPEFDVTPAFNARSIVLPVMRVEGVTWGMLVPARSGQPHRRPGLGGDARRPLRCRPRGQPLAVRQLGQRRARRLGRQPRRAVHALRPGDPRGPRARFVRHRPRCCCPRAARRSRPISRAGASSSSSIAPRTSARSCAMRRRMA